MTYFKLNAFHRGNEDWMLEEFREGRMHFGWSPPECDLREIQKIDRTDRLPKQKKSWKYTQFLLKRISVNDRIVVQLKRPLRKFLLAEVVGDYFFQDPPKEDFNHILPIEPIAENFIDINSKIVPDYLRHALSKRGHYYEIYPQDAIDQLNRIIDNELWNSEEADEKRTFETELTRTKEEVIQSIKKSIHKHWKGKDFEKFVGNLFSLIPNVEVKTQGDSGKGWDLLLRIIDPITGEALAEKVPVQCKAYKGKVTNLKSIRDIERAIENSGARIGYIVTLGDLSEKFHDFLIEKEEELSEALKREINIQVVDEDDLAEIFLSNESQFTADLNA